MVDQASEPRFRSKFPRPPREDGRVQCLVYLPPGLVRRLGGVAHDRNEYVYQIVERVLTNALDRLKDPIVSREDWPATVPDANDDGAAEVHVPIRKKR